VSQAVGAPRVSLWGHRGTRLGAPENSLAAFELALSQGADGIELDVRPCKSGELVVIHDPDLQRVAGDPRTVAELAASQLNTIDLGGGQAPPLLRQAAALVLGAGKRLNIELKADVPDRQAAARALVDEVSEFSSAELERVVASCFDRGLAQALGEALPELAVAWLLSPKTPRHPDDLLGLRGVHPHHSLADAAQVARWHAQGLFVNVWTVNDGAQARRLQAAGVDGLITDDVPRMRQALG